MLPVYSFLIIAIDFKFQRFFLCPDISQPTFCLYFFRWHVYEPITIYGTSSVGYNSFVEGGDKT